MKIDTVEIAHEVYTSDDVRYVESVYVGPCFKGHEVPEHKVYRVWGAPDGHEPPDADQWAGWSWWSTGTGYIFASYGDVARAATRYRRNRALESAIDRSVY